MALDGASRQHGGRMRGTRRRQRRRLTQRLRRIADNTTASGINGGGGIYDKPSDGVGISPTLSIVSTTISGNTAGGSGGGIFLAPTTGQGTVMLADGVVIDGNTSGAHSSGIAFGGGIAIAMRGSVTILDSQMTKNTVSTSAPTQYGGGGLGIDNDADAAQTSVGLFNTTISGNRSPTIGGGLDNRFATTRLQNVTVTNNRADSDGNGSGTGGGLNQESSSGSLALTNTLVAGNLRGTGATADDVGGMLFSPSSYNLIGTGGSGGLANGVNGN